MIIRPSADNTQIKMCISN